MIPTAATTASQSSAGVPTSLPMYASTALYVGDLSPEVTEAILYDHFNNVAPVESVKVCRDSFKKSLRYAYVNFRNVEDAERAMEALNYTPIRGTPCRIMWSRPDAGSGRRSNEGNLYIKNLDPSVDTRALHDTFSLYGNIMSCKVATDERGQSKGYGFVQYETPEAAETAIAKLNGLKLGSKEIFVTHHQKRTDRLAEKADLFTNLYVRDFPPAWNEEILSKIFGEHGPVTSVWLPKGREGATQAGFACVNFKETADAKKALEQLNGKYVEAEGICSDQEAAAAQMKKERVPAPETTESPVVDETSVTKAVDNDEEEAQTPKTYTVYRLFVDRARDRNSVAAAARSEKVNVFVKSLPDSVDDATLHQMFEGFGRITSAKVMKDEEGRSKGFGFVCFTTAEEATKAIAEMHMKYYQNKPLYVGLAEQKDKRIARLRRHFSQQQWVPPRQSPHHPMPNPGPPFLPVTGPAVQAMWKHNSPGQYMTAAPGAPNPMMPMLYHPHPAVAGIPAAAPAPTAAPAALQKQILGEKLFPLVYQYQPQLAGKITGMMLDMDESELQILLNDENELRSRIEEAIRVLRAAAGINAPTA